MGGELDLQFWMNIVAVIAIGVGGWFGRSLWDAVENLKADIHQIEVDMPSNYLRKDEFSDGMKEIKDMLNRIFDKLDGKVDKP